MAGLRSASQSAGSTCRAREFCAHLRAAERSFRAALERRREGSAWLEATRKDVYTEKTKKRPLLTKMSP